MTTVNNLPTHIRRETRLADNAWLDERPATIRSSGDTHEQLEYLLRFLWRWKMLFVAVFTTILAAGLVYLVIVPERYTVHSTIMVGFRTPELATEQNHGRPNGEPDTDAAIELLRATPALEQVSRQLNLAAQKNLVGTVRGSIFHRFRSAIGSIFTSSDDQATSDTDSQIAAQLAKDIRIERIGRSAFLDVSYVSSNPVMAAKIVNTLSRYVAKDESFLSRTSIANRAGFPIVKMSVVTEATAPQEPTSPNVPVVLSLTTLFALGAGIMALMFKHLQLLRTVRSIEEVTRRGVRTLGLIPDTDDISLDRTASVALVANDPDHVFSASVASLHAAITTLPWTRNAQNNAMVLLLTSPLASEGKSTTAAALATSMALADKRVLLLDADLRSPTLHRSFGVDRSPGLSEYVRAQVSLEMAIQRGNNIHFLAAGKPMTSPLHILDSERFHMLMRVARNEYDVILVDSPPVLAVGDAKLLAQIADHVIVVARWGSTSWNALKQALRTLRDSGARVAGVAVSHVDATQLSLYDYGGAEIYGSHYGTRVDADN
ncbi:MAG: polysaccharide biosynthesis tyrosine autokinase [Alphaproteobacteria bacterium]|nr:polysaccharide biosynthesis tyrosine autokinase [Alphaproteobacteria bacterium]